MQLQLYFEGMLCIFSARRAKTKFISRHSVEMDVPIGSYLRMSRHMGVNICGRSTCLDIQWGSSCMQSIRAQTIHTRLTESQPAIHSHSCRSPEKARLYLLPPLGSNMIMHTSKIPLLRLSVYCAEPNPPNVGI